MRLTKGKIVKIEGKSEKSKITKNPKTANESEQPPPPWPSLAELK
jgi:hypothetical protein